GDLEGVGDVLQRGARVEEVDMLEDHADTAAGLAQPGTRAAGEVDAVDRDRARGRGFESGQAADEGGLAGPGAADDAVDLAGRDRQVDLLQGDGVCEHLSQAAQFDHRRLLVWLVSADHGGGRRGNGDGRPTVQ